jgi:hypothetical protein
VVYIRGVQQWYISEVCSSGMYLQQGYIPGLHL